MSPDQSLRGHVDSLSADWINGWAHDDAQADEPTEVLILVDERLAACVVAGAFRQDLADAGVGNGRKAFGFDPRPFLGDGREHRVRVAFARTGETLPNGRAVVARSAAAGGVDWDRPRPASLSLPPAMARLQAQPEDSWPLLSVIVPNFNTPVLYLDRAVKSVLGQQYPRWELCIADNCSTDPAVLDYLRGIEGQDPRIHVAFRPVNGGISASTNTAIALATGGYCALLDADDELTPEALAEVAAHIVSHPSVDVIYTDQDKIDEAGRSFEPFHKPDWSPYFFLGVMYVGHLLTIRASLLRELHGCDSTYDKVQDYELMLRLSERTSRIDHIPKILYHWRAIAGSLASSSQAKDSINELQAAAIRAHLARRGIDAGVAPHPTLPHRAWLVPKPRPTYPKVTLLMPSACKLRYTSRCLRSILEQTTYPNFELQLVVNEIRWNVPEQAAFLEQLARDRRIQIIRYPDQPYNFSRFNNWAARQAGGEVLVLCNDDVEVGSPDWLERLLVHLELPGVGAVAPLLAYPDGSVQHAGVVLGFRGTADHVMRGFPADSDGYHGSLSCSREVAALTAACLMVRTADYWAVGGMRECLATIYNDLDFCLRLRRSGRALLYAASVRMTHHESVSRGSDYDVLERSLILDAYGPDIARGDPYYNPNFSRNSPDYRIRA